MAKTNAKPKTSTSKKKTTTTKKTTSKKVVNKKTPTKKVDMASVDSISLIDTLLPPPSKNTTSKDNKPDKKLETKKTTKKTSKPKTPVIPTTVKNDKKLKAMSKEEKAMYKKLWEHFNYVANLTMVIEERMMDQKLIPDLTIGELHVLETVDRLNGQPMSKIAAALKVTVGSLTIGVNRLVNKEYLLRIRDDNDHRVVNLSVTPKAKKVLKIHDKFHEEILMGVLDGVTIRDATKVMAQFNRVLENYINPKERQYANTSKISTK